MAERIFKGIEKMSIVMKLGIVAVSGYLVWRRFRKEVIVPEVEVPPGATIPLATASAQTLPSDGTQVVAYQGASPDQVNTTKALASPQAAPLDPNTLAKMAIQTGASELLQREGMESKKALDVAGATGQIFNAFLLNKTA